MRRALADTPGTATRFSDHGATVARRFLGAFIRADAEELIVPSDPGIALDPRPLIETPEYRERGGVHRWLEEVSKRRVELSFHIEGVQGGRGRLTAPR